MKLYNIKLIAVAIMVSALSFSCSNDDDRSDDDGGMMAPDFTGTFMQEDHMGRAAINTVLSGTDALKNSHNVTIPSNMQGQFQSAFLNQAVALHASFGAEYETNILGLDATTLTSILANDVLQVATNAQTTYFQSTSLFLTGRNLTDDVVDVSLILLFGGEDGARFNGQTVEGDDDDDDDSNDSFTLPILVTDNVDASGETPSSTFPYLEDPHN